MVVDARNNLLMVGLVWALHSILIIECIYAPLCWDLEFGN